VRGLNAWYGESHALHGVDLDIWRAKPSRFLAATASARRRHCVRSWASSASAPATITLAGKDLMRVPLHRTAMPVSALCPKSAVSFATLSVHENLLLPPVVAKGGRARCRLTKFLNSSPI
jgi:branched-chain amino acid transport system ATP-binding protein